MGVVAGPADTDTSAAPLLARLVDRVIVDPTVMLCRYALGDLQCITNQNALRNWLKI